MPKDHIEVSCPGCGEKTLLTWPTTRQRHAETQCPSCKRSFAIAEAVERTIVGKIGRRNLHSVAGNEHDRD